MGRDDGVALGGQVGLGGEPAGRAGWKQQQLSFVAQFKCQMIQLTCVGLDSVSGDGVGRGPRHRAQLGQPHHGRRSDVSMQLYQSDAFPRSKCINFVRVNDAFQRCQKVSTISCQTSKPEL